MSAKRFALGFRPGVYRQRIFVSTARCNSHKTPSLLGRLHQGSPKVRLSSSSPSSAFIRSPKISRRSFQARTSSARRFESKLISRAVEVAKRRTGFDAYDRQAYVLKLLRSAMCTHPEWTNYSDVARLDLAHGRTVPAITGRSSPRALKMHDADIGSSANCRCLEKASTSFPGTSLRQSGCRKFSAIRQTGRSRKWVPIF